MNKIMSEHKERYRKEETKRTRIWPEVSDHIRGLDGMWEQHKTYGEVHI